MFTSVLANTTITLTQIGMCILASIVCGLFIAFTYKTISYSSKSFITTIAVLPVMVMAVILMVNGNLGVGVAVAGSFSLVRFRSLPGKASDIGIIFLAMAIGLATGMGYISFAALFTVIVCILLVVFEKTSFLEANSNYRHLRICIPEDLDYTNVFEDIFTTYTKKHTLQGIKTVNLGSMYMVTYDTILKDISKEKEMLDALRTRNGNLTISASLQPGGQTEL